MVGVGRNGAEAGMSQREVKTKIVCTIGPASRARKTMAAMIEAGMNVARLNFAHGTFEEHATIIADVRAAARATGRRLAILADLPGPKLRIGRLAEQPVELERGQSSPSRSARSPAMRPARRPPSTGCRRR